mmetsp:Transcript_103476/g.301908  ORF Transcript_103476/g.301908 Transcript_103476/m.301908 type:complete len:527 (-) Transcript_103476:8-1588(-)
MFSAVARPLLSPPTWKVTAQPGVRNSAPFWRCILCANRSPSNESQTMNPHSPFQDRHEPTSCMPKQWSYLLVPCTGMPMPSAPVRMPSIWLKTPGTCSGGAAGCGSRDAGAAMGGAGGGGPRSRTCAACGRPRESIARRNCTGLPALLFATGTSPRKASLCTKRSPSKRSGHTMKPQGSRQDRSKPCKTSPLSSSCSGTAIPGAFGIPGMIAGGQAGAGSRQITFAAWHLPLASVMTSKLTWRFMTACATSAGLEVGTSSCRCSWWQKRSPSKCSGATMKPHSFFQERIWPVSGPAPAKSSAAGVGSVTSVAVARFLASMATEKETGLPASGSPSKRKFWRCTKRSPSNFVQVRKPQSPFQLRILPRSLVPTNDATLSAVARVKDCVKGCICACGAGVISGGPRFILGSLIWTGGAAGTAPPFCGVNCCGAICSTMISAACARPLASILRRNCTDAPARSPGGTPPTKFSRCAKRSPSNAPGHTMNPQGSRHDRSTPASGPASMASAGVRGLAHARCRCPAANCRA